MLGWVGWAVWMIQRFLLRFSSLSFCRLLYICIYKTVIQHTLSRHTRNLECMHSDATYIIRRAFSSKRCGIGFDRNNGGHYQHVFFGSQPMVRSFIMVLKQHLQSLFFKYKFTQILTKTWKYMEIHPFLLVIIFFLIYSAFCLFGGWFLSLSPRWISGLAYGVCERTSATWRFFLLVDEFWRTIFVVSNEVGNTFLELTISACLRLYAKERWLNL